MSDLKGEEQDEENTSVKGEHSKNKMYDYELVRDTYLLRAHCCFRLGDVPEFASNYNIARKFEHWKVLKEGYTKKIISL